MKKEILLLFFFSYLLSSGCDKENDHFPLYPDDLQLVTGLRIVDEFEGIFSIVGNPSDSGKEVEHRNDGTIGHDVNFEMYPNPTIDYLTVYSSSEITSAWIVPGKPSTNYQTFDFDEHFESNALDTIGLGVISVRKKIDMREANMLMFDLSDLEKGFYKVIIEVDESRLLWQSIYRLESHEQREEAPYNIWK
ncbi:hypothetical protein [Marinilabilia rubra]|uniref:Lipoprotein n=1 Tax=Marinilabilia rubra TaxID=2162893 RepID=A0A2U2B583_9BACT|nr:hypothetical protein [Marinilabilia rubra]PWD98207.1 hypothetical protein DDZ16_17100 [Marinilabilia rubra]